MPKISYIEKTIYELEEVKVSFVKNGKNARSDNGSIQKNYQGSRKTRNSANVGKLKEKLKGQFPGYDFIVYCGDGTPARGNMLLGNVRDTYLDEE